MSEWRDKAEQCLHFDEWDSPTRKALVYTQAVTPLTKIIQARHSQVKRAVGQIGAYVKALKYRTAKEMNGTPVKLLKTISNNGGETFKAGEIMYIVDKWKGWTLSRQPNGGWDIRCVSERQFEILPNTVCTPTDCGLPASDSLSTPAAISG